VVELATVADADPLAHLFGALMDFMFAHAAGIAAHRLLLVNPGASELALGLIETRDAQAFFDPEHARDNLADLAHGENAGIIFSAPAIPTYAAARLPGATGKGAHGFTNQKVKGAPQLGHTHSTSVPLSWTVT
jgi:hypothetical protein